MEDCFSVAYQTMKLMRYFQKAMFPQQAISPCLQEWRLMIIMRINHKFTSYMISGGESYSKVGEAGKGPSVLLCLSDCRHYVGLFTWFWCIWRVFLQAKSGGKMGTFEEWGHPDMTP